MPKTLPLLRGEITLSSARERELNILRQLQYPLQKEQFLHDLDRRRAWMKTTVAHHLNLDSSNLCEVAEVKDWRHGSFNLCVPVTIHGWTWRRQQGHRVLLRFPLPYRVGDAFFPGNADEKLRCEAGAYAWLEENNPDIPIPRLYGFATSTGEMFTRLENLPFHSRCWQFLRRMWLSIFGLPQPSRYIRHVGPTSSRMPQAGYLLIEYIEEGQAQMLSETWFRARPEDARRRKIFLRDLACIYLKLARIPLPRIGSFRINNEGFLELKNRPLTLEIHDLENEPIPTGLRRDETFLDIDSYVSRILRAHDNRLRHQPNAVNNLADFLYQVTSLTTMRAVLPSIFQAELTPRPFIFTLTDLHPSNIFVDEDWHITALVDLEWACSLPVQMLQVPIGLTDMAVDQIAKRPEVYDKIRIEFLEALATEEEIRSETECGFQHNLSTVMKKSWNQGQFWASLALSSPTGLFTIFSKQILPRFIKYHSEWNNDEFNSVMPWFWSTDMVELSNKKIRDKDEYDIALRDAFGE